LKLLTLSLTILCLALAAPAFAGVIYSDGPTNGTLFGIDIDGPGGLSYQTLSDGFVATGSGTASSVDFGLFLIPGNVPTSVTWSLGTAPFASDISSGVSTLTYIFLGSNLNQYGYDVYTATATGLSGNFSAGSTYWLTFGGAFDNSGNPVAWDVNKGPANCQWAYAGGAQGNCGALPDGNSFTLYSSGSNTVPEPGSIMMLGTGALGLAGVLRRKISL
jgi:hypothetical protein